MIDHDQLTDKSTGWDRLDSIAVPLFVNRGTAKLSRIGASLCNAHLQSTKPSPWYYGNGEICLFSSKDEDGGENAVVGWNLPKMSPAKLLGKFICFVKAHVEIRGEYNFFVTDHLARPPAVGIQFSE